jgi:biopolymer transport protein ExbD
MLNRTKIVLVMLVIAMLATTWGMVGTAGAQKAAVPNPQDKFAIGEDEAKQLLLLVDTDKKGKVSKQEWMKFMEAEFVEKVANFLAPSGPKSVFSRELIQ